MVEKLLKTVAAILFVLITGVFIFLIYVFNIAWGWHFSWVELPYLVFPIGSGLGLWGLLRNNMKNVKIGVVIIIIGIALMYAPALVLR